MEIPPGIRAVTPRDDLGNTPAATDIRKGIVYVNPQLFYKYPEDYRAFILAHEAGHINQQTRNEHEADKWAFNWYTQTGRSTANLVHAMTKVLPYTTTEQKERTWHQLKRAAAFDYRQTGNEAAKVISNLQSPDELPAALERLNEEFTRPRKIRSIIIAAVILIIILAIWQWIKPKS